ncbi:hypothetical protein CMQ_354 [Grosmannia clavigera kw1407]|uniref:Pentatricopeptide repeat protein n=1 Tax=Grosmannia clavigera (strain kw1407 / UAMH 11150) TaxID=655863 RepID=F0XFW9_GROCL|nr:uncharacterized protein CMQ_354 [Grosmannia clavigera kw1407]EFX03426.1 hypothetical protein CMQ_354 [Grosmannia clavigera kw1407]
MPPRVELQWRRVRPLFPGAAAALSGSRGAMATCHRRRGTSRWYSSGGGVGMVGSGDHSVLAATTTTASEEDGQSVVSWPTLAREAEDRRCRQLAAEAASQEGKWAKRAGETDSTGSGRSAGAVLMDRLARDQLQPPGVEGSASSLSALVEPCRRYGHPGETRRSQLRHQRSLIRQARLEAIRQAQLRPLPDWRAILRRLAEGTAAGQTDNTSQALLQLALPRWTATATSSSSGWHREAVALVLGRDSLAAGELLRGTDGSLGAIRDRTDCVLRMYEQQTETPDSSTAANHHWLLTLSGTATAIRQAAAEVLRLARDAVPIDVPAGLPSDIMADSASAWRLVSTSLRRDDAQQRNDPVFRPYVLRHGVHDIPRPLTWTRDSLEHYVAALTNGRPARQMADDDGLDLHQHDDEAPPPPRNHCRAVIDLLQAVFADDAARPALSTAALRMALGYMCRIGEAFRPDARALFVRAEALGLPLDTATFNAMLASQVKTQDLRNFGATLLLMRGRGHAPDLDTWLLFLHLFASEEVKRHILHAMHARGLLENPAAVRRVAPELVHHDAERALREHWHVHSDRYGHRWLGRDAAHRILDVLASHGCFHDCQRLVALMRPPLPADPDEMQDRHDGNHHRYIGAQPPNTTTYNVILTHCKVQNSLRSAIDVMAWHRRLPHVIGVVWHYASAARQTSHWMRKRVSQLLAGQGGGSNRGKPADKEFLSPEDEQRLSYVLRAGIVAASTPSNTPACLGNTISGRLAHRYQGWAPMMPLGDALHEALRLDNELLRERFTGGNNTIHNSSNRGSPSDELSLLRIQLRRKRSKATPETESRYRNTTPPKTAYMNIYVRKSPPRHPAA